MMEKEILSYSFWLHVEPSREIPGEWVAHNLDLDVVSQGSSLKQAFDMVIEATMMTVCDDLNANSNPLLRRAPAEYWTRLWQIVNNGTKLQIKDVLATPGKVELAAQIQVQAVREVQTVHIEPEKTPEPTWDVPIGIYSSNDARQ